MPEQYDSVNYKLPATEVTTQTRVYALQHLETEEFVCLLMNDIDWLVSFTDGDSVIEFQLQQKLLEHTKIVIRRIAEYPFECFWLDGVNRVIVHS